MRNRTTCERCPRPASVWVLVHLVQDLEPGEHELCDDCGFDLADRMATLGAHVTVMGRWEAS